MLIRVFNDIESIEYLHNKQIFTACSKEFTIEVLNRHCFYILCY